VTRSDIDLSRWSADDTGRPRAGSGLRTLNRAIGLVVVRGNLGEQFLLGVDTESVVGGFDGDGAAGVDALPGSHDSAPATDTPPHPDGFGRRHWWWAGGAGNRGCGPLRPE
jgi:hypothetical protein